MDIDKRLKELEEEKRELEKKKNENLIEKKEAFRCPKCNKIVIKSETTEMQKSYGLCYGCFSNKRNQEIHADMLKKIKFARIIDVELTSGYASQIESITLYKQGMKYILKPIESDGDAYIILDSEWKDDEELPVEEVEKPWHKSRKEQPLIKVP